jgi:hypothetical protein
LKKIRKLLEEHQLKCEKAGKFVEAELAKQRVIQFKKLEEDKALMEIKKRHADMKIQVENEQKEELENFNQKWDNDFYNLNFQYGEAEKKLGADHDSEMNAIIEEFNAKYPEIPKPSAELLNLNKVIDSLVKQKEYSIII